MDTCPDAVSEAHPCQANPTIAPWAEKKCNIINSDVFKDCHAKVPPGKFYENCLYDTCGCNAGGDCQCFCTSVAAYAQVGGCGRKYGWYMNRVENGILIPLLLWIIQTFFRGFTCLRHFFSIKLNPFVNVNICNYNFYFKFNNGLKQIETPHFIGFRL